MLLPVFVLLPTTIFAAQRCHSLSRPLCCAWQCSKELLLLLLLAEMEVALLLQLQLLLQIKGIRTQHSNCPTSLKPHNQYSKSLNETLVTIV
jgi:hypothetical protein